MAKQPRNTMNISLSPQMQKYISKLVESGDYQSASEVVRESVRMLRQRNVALRELQRKVDEGMRSIERGDTHSAEAVFAEWDRRSAEAKRAPRRRRSA